MHSWLPTPRGCWAILAFLGLLAGAAPSHADAPAAAGTPSELVVRDMNFFYANRSLFDEPRRTDLELAVIYYAPEWNVLWAMNGDLGFYARIASEPVNLQTGRRYRLQGTLSNAKGLQVPADGITDLGDASLPTPLDATARVTEWAQFNYRWTRVQAFVDRQEQPNPDHLRLTAVVNGHRVNLRVKTQGKVLPDFTGTFIDATGLYVYSAPAAGSPASIDLWCPLPQEVRIVDAEGTDLRFTLTPTPMEELQKRKAGETVHVVGRVHRFDTGRSLVLRDESAQVSVISGQVTPFPDGSVVEAVGQLAFDGPEVRLLNARYRMVSAELTGGRVELAPTSRDLRFVDQVASLTPDELRDHPKVNLFGVVTWYHDSLPYFYFQDATGGLRINRKPTDTTPLQAGAFVRVEGHALAGAWSPEINATALIRGTDGSLGEPRILTLDQASAGVSDGQWIELTGLVREARTDGPWTHLSVTTPTGEFTVQMPLHRAAPNWINSIVRLKGVCTSTLNARGEPAGIRLLVQSANNVGIELPPPKDFRSLPIQSIARMNARGTRLALNRWVRVRGTVTYVDSGSHIYLQDGSAAVMALSRDTLAVELGDTVDVVGLLGRDDGKQLLREARVLETRLPPVGPVQPVAVDGNPDRSIDGLVATLEGRLVNLVDRSDHRRLVFGVNQRSVAALLPNKTASLPEGCEVGALVRVTGIYHVELNNFGEPKSYDLLLRDSADVKVVRRAPWWNLSRTLKVSAALAFLAALGIGWVALLRRTVKNQTRELVRQKDKEAKLEAELERSSRLESLGLLAGGIAHDFNNMLTVIVGNLTLSILETPSDSKAGEFLSEAEKAALRARELTQQLLTFARGGEPVRSPHRLGPLIQEGAAFALHGTSVTTEFDLAPNLPPALVDKGQVTQAINNLVLHAAKSATKAGRLRLTLRESVVFEQEIPNLPAGTYLKFTLQDNGPGVSAESLDKMFDPYFSTGPQGNGLGLATARSIIRRHHGHIEATSRVGQGTTFNVWIPTTAELPASETTPPVAGPQTRRLRILFMDDDESIRRFAQTVLTRMGHVPTLVNDGAAAVHAYAAAWERNEAFDLVILDLTVVGGMGGKEALEHLQNISSEVRAIVSSGYSSDPVMADHRAHGFAGIVSKPYKISELEQAIIRVMTPKDEPRA